MSTREDMRAAWGEAGTYERGLFVLSKKKTSQVLPRIPNDITGRISGWLPVPSLAVCTKTAQDKRDCGADGYTGRTTYILRTEPIFTENIKNSSSTSATALPRDIKKSSNGLSLRVSERHDNRVTWPKHSHYYMDSSPLATLPN